jgi:lysophospholipase L1-like esterase
MSHVVLIGDSIFDNAAYVGGGPDVIAQLRERLPPGWKATLRAVDGSVLSDVPGQIADLPTDATHVIISAGGNDALQHTDLLMQRVESMGEAFLRIAEISPKFEGDYRRVVGALRRRRTAAALCTIYYPSFPEPEFQRIAVAALAVFNDCIIRAAFEAGWPLLDLRLICNEPADYANPIEPSVAGGAKIAEAIFRVVTQHDFKQCRTVVYT